MNELVYGKVLSSPSDEKIERVNENVQFYENKPLDSTKEVDRVVEGSIYIQGNHLIINGILPTESVDITFTREMMEDVIQTFQSVLARGVVE